MGVKGLESNRNVSSVDGVVGLLLAPLLVASWGTNVDEMGSIRFDLNIVSSRSLDRCCT